MLSDPNIGKIIPKVGNRYEAALAIAKRARNIENKRVIEGDSCIRDAVDIASIEISENKVFVKKSGVYVIEPYFEAEEIEEIIEEVDEMTELEEAIDEKEKMKQLKKKIKEEKKLREENKEKKENDEIEELEEIVKE